MPGGEASYLSMAALQRWFRRQPSREQTGSERGEQPASSPRPRPRQSQTVSDHRPRHAQTPPTCLFMHPLSAGQIGRRKQQRPGRDGRARSVRSTTRPHGGCAETGSQQDRMAGRRRRWSWRLALSSLPHTHGPRSDALRRRRRSVGGRGSSLGAHWVHWALTGFTGCSLGAHWELTGRPGPNRDRADSAGLTECGGG